LLQTLGMPAVAEGNVILLNEASLGIVEACSGLRMLVVFFALSTAVALVARRPFWERVFLVFSAIPIALFTNVVRITATGVAYETVGGETGQFIFHDLAGWLMMPLALALLGIGLANAGGPASAAVGASQVVLKTANIGGIAVLTNAQGLTLYLFVPDTPTASKCTGSCTAYWPPVFGKPQAGPGVTGRLGTIRRPDGSLQATYDGHPLYTYIGDSNPGQNTGDKLDLNGGYWYEVPVSG